MKQKKSTHHVREHGNLLEGIEKPALIWIAKRLPNWVTSDRLTLLGLLSMAGVGLSYWAARYHEWALGLVIATLALNWFGDSLDGTLARVHNRQRPRYGFYVDHVIDLVGALFLLVGLAVSGFMNPIIALGLLVGFLMVSAEAYLATHTLGVFRLSFMRIGPTELRILLSIGTLFLFRTPMVSMGELGVFRLFDVGGICGMVGMAVALIVSAVKNTHFLYHAEPLHR